MSLVTRNQLCYCGKAIQDRQVLGIYEARVRSAVPTTKSVAACANSHKPLDTGWPRTGVHSPLLATDTRLPFPFPLGLLLALPWKPTEGARRSTHASDRGARVRAHTRCTDARMPGSADRPTKRTIERTNGRTNHRTSERTNERRTEARTPTFLRKHC